MKIAGLLAGIALALPSAAGANWFATEFSAETYQTQPQQPAQSGKMFVGKNGMRSELTQGGRTAVQIINPGKQTMWLVFPDEKTYMEQKLPAGAAPSAGSDANPCSGMQGVQCRQLGEETLNGRKAVKWEMSGPSGQQLIWTDGDHKFPVRAEQGGKVGFELRFLGSEAVNGRAAEKWETTLAGQNGQNVKALKWYDPKLNTALREEVQGGFVRELRNIKEGTQPDSLFTVPEGYRKIEAPQGQSQQGMPQR